MKIKKFNTIADALFGSTKKDKTYSFVWHRLKRGERIREHYHNEANEWLVAAGGDLLVTIGRETRQFSSKGAAIVVFLPKKKKHSLVALTAASYFVIRDKEDRVIYSHTH